MINTWSLYFLTSKLTATWLLTLPLNSNCFQKHHLQIVKDTGHSQCYSELFIWHCFLSRPFQILCFFDISHDSPPTSPLIAFCSISHGLSPLPTFKCLHSPKGFLLVYWFIFFVIWHSHYFDARLPMPMAPKCKSPRLTLLLDFRLLPNVVCSTSPWRSIHGNQHGKTKCVIASHLPIWILLFCFLSMKLEF